MELSISNKLIITNASSELFEWCRKELEFPNPEYAKKEKMGLWTGNDEPVIVLWELRGNDVILPYGVLTKLEEAFPDLFDMHYYDFTGTGFKIFQTGHIDYQSNIELFDYQEEALTEASLYRSGVIVMPCGSGKTQTALELVARLGLRTLWLTHTYELLKQSMDRAKECFGIPETEYGTITNGKINVGKALTFATVQTMANIDLDNYRDYWGCVIVDECHKAVGTPTKLMMFYQVISSLNARYKYGLTATPERNDGLQKCMFALLGNKLCEIPDSVVKKNTVPIKVYQAYSKIYNPEMFDIVRTDGTIDYTHLINNLCECEERNKDIAQLVNMLNSTGKTCLVLSDRVSHLEALRRLVGEDYTLQIYSMSGSEKARKARKECLEKLRKKDIRCLFATYPLAKEGLDIPTLDCVVLATPKKDRISVIQSCGRAGRRAEGKTEGYVIDYVDTECDILFNYSKTRKAIYKSKKYSLEIFER